MIYRGPGFLAVVYTPAPSPPPHVNKLSLFLSLFVCRWPSLLTGEVGGLGAWPSIHRSILSALQAGEAQGMPVEAQLVADVVLQN